MRLSMGFPYGPVVALILLSGDGYAGWHVEEVLRLKPRADAEFIMVAGIAVDRNENIYVADPMSYALWKFDRTGKLLGKAGRRGEKPGEFHSPSMLIVSGDTIAVMQSTNPWIQFFTTSLQPLGARRPYDGQPLCLAADGRGRMTVAGMREQGDRQVLCCLPSMMATGGIRSAIPPGGHTEEFFQVSHLAITPNGMTVVAFQFENRIVWIDARGRLVRDLSVPSLRRLSAVEDAEPIPDETAFKSVAVDARGRIYILGGSLAPHPHRDLFLFDRRGRSLGVATLPSPSRLIAVDARGNVYGTSDEGGMLLKYRLSQGK
jgi:hypothetical protein